jgi:plastocyanin
MRTLPLALILALLLAAPAAAATRNVKVADNFFKPKSVTVAKGTTVKWNWVGEHAHDVFVKRGPAHFHSAVKKSGSYKRVMRRRGTYRIVCLIHESSGMRMTLRVT